MASYLMGILGTLASLGVGWNLGLSLRESTWGVGAANIAAVLSGILTLRAEKVSWLKATLLRGWLGTWLCLAILFFGTILLLAPPLRNPQLLGRMALPLIFSTGLCLRTVFGPLQDWMVRRAQKNR